MSKSENLLLRVSEREKALLTLASQLDGKSLSEFVRKYALRRAMRVIDREAEE